ncbi:Plasma membrane low glucose sensor [Boothiomyces sp. JEL0838]|nr:Plasma membrane low glucose sensor [Boothiomyces sp. JEL0838]
MTNYGIIVAFAAAIGGLLFGYEIGVIGQVLGMQSFKSYFGFGYVDGTGTYVDYASHTSNESFTTFSFTFGCAIGALFVSYFASVWGRKKTIILSGCFFLFGATAQTFSFAFWFFVAARFIGGMGIGVSSAVVPLYIAETAATNVRGTMIAIQQLMITIGILVASIINTVIIKSYGDANMDNIEWRMAIGMQMIPAVLLILIMTYMPESPRWLASQERNNETIDVLVKLRGLPAGDATLKEEYEEIFENVKFEKGLGNASWGELLSKGIFIRVIIGIVLQFFQQASGINVFFYYVSSLLTALGTSADFANTTFPIIHNFVNMVSTFPGMYAVEKFGRRNLLILGGFGMAIAQIGIWLFKSQVDSNTGRTLAVVCVELFVLFFGSTWGPVVWVYQSEIFPLRVREKGTSVATFSNWMSGAIISFLTPYVRDAINEKIYFIFGTFALCGALFVIAYVPETRNVPLEEMDSLFGSPSDPNAPVKEVKGKV